MKESHKELHQKCNLNFDENCFLFINEKCNRFPVYIMSSDFRKITERLNFLNIRFHDLRHACAVLLKRIGCNLKDIQAWLGHGDFSTTANIYLHINDEDKEIMAEKLTQALNIEL